MRLPPNIKDKVDWQGVTVQFRKIERDLLQKLADQKGMSVHALIRQAMIEYVDNELWSAMIDGIPSLSQFKEELRANPSARFDSTRLSEKERKQLDDLDDAISMFKAKMPRGPKSKKGPGRRHQEGYND